MKSDVPPTYMGNLMKMIPLFREFSDPKPTHMDGTYLYQQYVMYTPSLPGWCTSAQTTGNPQNNSILFTGKECCQIVHDFLSLLRYLSRRLTFSNKDDLKGFGMNNKHYDQQIIDKFTKRHRQNLQRNRNECQQHVPLAPPQYIWRFGPNQQH